MTFNKLLYRSVLDAILSDRQELGNFNFTFDITIITKNIPLIQDVT